MSADLPIEAILDTAHATFRVTPPHGRAVTFEVALRRDGRYRYSERYVVQMLGSWGDGFSTHVSFEAAVRSALARARKYARAYSVARAA